MNQAGLARTLLTAMNSAKSVCPHHFVDFARPIQFDKFTDKLTTVEGEESEYAFEMIGSTLRFGRNVTAELGADLEQFGAGNVLVMTDKGVARSRALAAVLNSLTRHRQKFSVFTDVRVEPSDKSMREAIEYARKGAFDAFVAVGGGSVIDTAKVAALFGANSNAELFDFAVRPFGKSLEPPHPMHTLIAVPTTSGTGSETTGTAIFDYEAEKCKTAIRHRMLRPNLALLDPLNTFSQPRQVALFSGLDVLCHALESYTAKPFNERHPRPSHPSLRPLYQGSNPISDIWALSALQIIRKYFRRSIEDREDEEARTQMLTAASFAGMGFGNAGVHLCHGLSYPISSQAKQSFNCPDYPPNQSLIPHGLSVISTAAACFQFTAEACPQRHARAAIYLGADISENANGSVSGGALAEIIANLMQDLAVPNGLRAMHFDETDLDSLTRAALNSLSALQISPRQHAADSIARIYEQSLVVY